MNHFIKFVIGRCDHFVEVKVAEDRAITVAIANLDGEIKGEVLMGRIEILTLIDMLRDALDAESAP